MRRLAVTGMIIGFLAVLTVAQSTSTELVVKGRVIDNEGNPVAGASVTAGPVGYLKGIVPMTTSNERGEFSVVVHQTGQFYVSAKKETDGYLNTGNPFYYPNPPALAFVTVLADQPAPFATVQFGPKAGALLMRVSDADSGETIRSVMVNLCRIEAPKYCHRFRSNAPRDVHSLLVSSAPFTFEVAAPGYQSAYAENSRDSELQVVRVLSETTKEISILMRKGSDKGTAQLPAPEIVSPADRTVLFDYHDRPRMLTIEWTAVPGAATYTVEVEVCQREAPDGGECRKGATPLTRWRQATPPSGIEGTRYESIFPGTQPGRWRVWAVDELGQPGMKSPWTLFFYRTQEKSTSGP